MNKFPINKALEAAIVAEADDDTPRLAYADWLDENGDPDRAAFIRVQCRLADLSPAEPDWVDLIERQAELLARLNPRQLGAHLDEEPFSFTSGDVHTHHGEPFRRGFPYFVDLLTDEQDWNRKEGNRTVRVLTKLVHTTTVRGLNLPLIPAERLRELLDAPVAARLTGLEASNYGLNESSEFWQLIADHPALGGVQQLHLSGDIEADAVAAFAKAKSLGSVRRLTMWDPDASASMTAKLAAAPWFRQLRHVRIWLGVRPSVVPMVTGLGRLPHLHTLDLQNLHQDGVRPLAAGKFPSLARLHYAGPACVQAMRALARGRFPRLTVFASTERFMGTTEFLELLKAKWLGQLRVLNLSKNSVRDKGLKALAAHPVAKTLRALRFGDNPIGMSSLAAFTTPGAFPELTTLDLGSYHKRKGTPAELAEFLSALQLPRLRHLNLEGWPLGNAGAKALAASPAIANLTRLNLSNCQIGDAGAKALLASPHLQNLVELQLSANAIKTGADALANPAVLPNLGVCELWNNKMTQKTADKLQRARWLVFTV